MTLTGLTMTMGLTMTISVIIEWNHLGFFFVNPFIDIIVKVFRRANNTIINYLWRSGMKVYQSFIISAIIGILLILGGCEEKQTTVQSTTTDEQALKIAVTEVDSVADFSASDEISIDDDGLNNPDFDGVSGGMITHVTLDSSITDSTYPVRWGRHIFWQNIVRTYNVTLQGDTLAYVLITKTIPGEFIVAWGIKTSDTVIIKDTVKKSFTETVQRNVTFKRVARTDNPRKNWVPIAITIVQGKTNGVNNFAIASLEVSVPARSYDTTFVDPLNQWFRLGSSHGSVKRCVTGDSTIVKLTITSTDSAAEMVYLRHGIGKGRMERRRTAMTLESTSGTEGNYIRVYSKTIRTKLPMGVVAARYNMITDVISKGTIYSTTLPFSNEFWGVPYIVVR